MVRNNFDLVQQPGNHSLQIRKAALSLKKRFSAGF